MKWLDPRYVWARLQDWSRAWLARKLGKAVCLVFPHKPKEEHAFWDGNRTYWMCSRCWKCLPEPLISRGTALLLVELRAIRAALEASAATKVDVPASTRTPV